MTTRQSDQCAFGLIIKKLLTFALLVIMLLSVGGASQPKLQYVVTIEPVGMILREVVGERAEVHVLIPPGASPHAYEPKPSDIEAISKADALFYCDEILDGWAAKMTSGHSVSMFGLVPEDLRLTMLRHDHNHGHGDKEQHNHVHGHDQHEHEASKSVYDPHFWMSPNVVKACLPKLLDELYSIDPDGMDEYRQNTNRFNSVLVELDHETNRMLSSLRGEYLLLFHPSMNYLMNDYGLLLAGVVEQVPGQEPSPKMIADLVELVKQLELKAVFTEPQLPVNPATTISRETGLPLFELDPLGGTGGRYSYIGLLRYNTRTLLEALVPVE